MIYLITKKRIADECRQMRDNSADWLPYSVVAGIFAMAMAWDINPTGVNLIGGSTFVTGVLSFAACQIGWHQRQNPLLRLALSVATTVGFAYFTSVPMISAVAFAVLGSVSKLWLDTLQKDGTIYRLLKFLSAGSNCGIAYEIFARSVQWATGFGHLSVGFSTPIGIGITAVIALQLIKICVNKKLENRQYTAYRKNIGEENQEIAHYTRNYDGTYKKTFPNRKIDDYQLLTGKEYSLQTTQKLPWSDHFFAWIPAF